MKEPITKEQEFILKFFTEMVEPRQMAQVLRQGTYLIGLSYIRSDEDSNPMSKKWSDDTFYFMNELAEVLDPYLEAKM